VTASPFGELNFIYAISDTEAYAPGLNTIFTVATGASVWSGAQPGGYGGLQGAASRRRGGQCRSLRQRALAAGRALAVEERCGRPCYGCKGRLVLDRSQYPSSPSGSSAMRLHHMIASVALLASGSGCGHLAPPQPRPRPQAPSAAAVPTASAQPCTLQDGDTVARLVGSITEGCGVVVTEEGATVTLSSPNTITVPEGVRLVLRAGARWNVTAGTDVVVRGSYELPLERTQVFGGEGRVRTAGQLEEQACPTAPRVVYPEWFGARVDDGNDDSLAISAALSFGERVELAAGTYDLQNRLLLTRHQTLVGQGVGTTRLSQLPDANIVQYPERQSPEDPHFATWRDVVIHDFIVGLASDCAAVRNLSIVGDRLPDDLRSLSNVHAKLGYDPVVSGIQISSHLGWKQGTPPIKDVVVSHVEVVRPASSCVAIQSDRAARDVLIEDLACTARNSRPNTSGLTIEAFHPTYANRFENITVRRCTFRGGSWGLYIAGVRNFVFEDSAVEAGAGAYNAALFYTSDNGHPITATVRNSSFTLMQPTPASRSVVELVGRGYAKDRAGVFPFLVATDSSLSFEGGSIASAEHPSERLVPLVLDTVGFESPVVFRGTTFTGGNYAILGADPARPAAFGGCVYEHNATPGAPTIIRDVTVAEVRKHRLHHSTFQLSECEFRRQASSAIKLTRGSLRLSATKFRDTRRAPGALRAPVVDVRGKRQTD